MLSLDRDSKLLMILPMLRWISPKTIYTAACSLVLSSCAHIGSKAPNMGGADISEEYRAAQIASESQGAYFYGRRYFVEKTRFWGYLRQPRQPWAKAKLVVMNESSRHTPDRLPEDGDERGHHGIDANHEYKITGHYTGRTIYEPATNLFLPEFKATSYKVVSQSPGWLFSPSDHYNRRQVTLLNDSVRSLEPNSERLP